MIQVVAGVIFRGPRVLIARRPIDVHLGGLWEFPGGKIEPPESPRAGLKRELWEELRVDVEVQCLLDRVRHQYEGQLVDIRFYRCRWRRHEPQPLKCAELAWVRRKDLVKYPFPAADAQLLRNLLDTGKWWKK